MISARCHGCHRTQQLVARCNDLRRTELAEAMSAPMANLLLSVNGAFAELD